MCSVVPDAESRIFPIEGAILSRERAQFRPLSKPGANLPIGYADGVDRALSNRIAGICMGRLVPQVGTISMDQMLFDVTDVPEAKEGEIITLIGSDGEHELFLADWAQILNTITYELASRMQLRLPRLFSGQRKT